MLKNLHRIASKEVVTQRGCWLLSGTGVRDSSEFSCRCEVLNPGFLQNQIVPLITEPSP